MDRNINNINDKMSLNKNTNKIQGDDKMSLNEITKESENSLDKYFPNNDKIILLTDYKHEQKIEEYKNDKMSSFYEKKSNLEKFLKKYKTNDNEKYYEWAEMTEELFRKLLKEGL